MSQISKELQLKLLVESCLTLGEYSPTCEFRSANSVAIALDGKPVILLGWEGDQESNDVADRLLSCEHFINAVTYCFRKGVIGSDFVLEKTIVSNNEVCSGGAYTCLVESKQGAFECGHGKGLLVAVLNQNNLDFAYLLCVNNNLMKCFYPNAKDLSIQIPTIRIH